MANQDQKLVFSKLLTKSDIESRLYISTRCLIYLPNFRGRRQVNFIVKDNEMRLWNLSCWKRAGRYSKPVVSGDWLALARHKEIRIGDRVTLLRKLGWDTDLGYHYQFEIIFERKITILGSPAVWGTI